MTRCLLLGAAFFLLASTASAELNDLEFVQLLRDRGFGEQAVDYLERLEKANAIPEDLKTVFNLELGRALLSDSETTQNVDRAAQDLVIARERLELFLKDHADHPDAALAWQSSAQISLQRGIKMRMTAMTQKDAARKTAQLTEARAEIERARPALVQAIALFADRLRQARLEEAGDRTKSKDKRTQQRLRKKGAQAAELATQDWIFARSLAASVDYEVGLTYEDPKNDARIAALNAASKGFDDIFQIRREAEVGDGKRAHLWQGRAVEALGDLRTALDIYQEVLAIAPNHPTDQDPPEALALFPEVKKSEIEVMLALKQDDKAFEEASLWLEDWRATRRTPGYQSIALMFAKMLQERAAKLPQKQADELVTKTIALLGDMAKIPGPFQTEAIRMRRDLSEKIGRHLEISSFPDAVALAEAAAMTGDWKGAIENYSKAMSMSENVLPRSRVFQTQLQLARSQRYSGDSAASFETSNALAHNKEAETVGPSAAVVAIDAALDLAATSDDKEAGRKRLFEIADYTRATWPKRAEADQATLALGKLKAVERDNAGAIQIFETIAPSSERYGDAQLLAAQSRWRELQIARSRDEVSADDFEKQREAVIAQLQLAIERLQKSSNSAAGESRSLSEAHLQLAEVFSDAKRTQEAIALYDPLVADLLQEPDAGLSAHMIRVATGAATAYLAAGDLAKASGVADFLSSKGGDIPQVNTVLVNFSTKLRDQCQQLAAAVKEKPGDADAAAKLKTSQDQAAAFVEKVCAHQQLALPQRIILGDTAADLGRSDIARQQFETALKMAESGQGAPEKVKAALIRVRSQLVGLLRRDKKYSEALVEVDKLLQETPRAMEPNLERARILTGIAETDPSKYPDAIAAWTKLRLAMAKMPKKPPEYYESVYGAAAGLAGQASSTSDAQAAAESRKQAKALLKATLALSPNLSGPEMVSRYEQLLAKLPQ